MNYHSVVIIRTHTLLDAGMSGDVAVTFVDDVKRRISEGYAVVIVS